MAINVANAADWQQRVLMAATWSQQQQESSSSPWRSQNDPYSHYDAAYDNASTHCHDDIYYQCPGDQPVLMIALRWAKILILKVGRTYYGAPLCLMMLPLLVGLTVGYMMGTRRNSSSKLKAKSNRFSLYNFVCNLWTYFSAVYLPSTIFSMNLIQHRQSFLKDDSAMVEKEDLVRNDLKSVAETTRESGVDVSLVPKHVAVIMDGNRRYGKKYFPENPTQGHWEGSKTLVNFCKWCIAEHVQILTVYAFSTENWNRSPDEVAALMAIFSKYCDELRVEAIQRNIRIRVLSTETDRIPARVKAGMKRMVDETAHCEDGLLLNICLSYGSRGEIVRACRQLATDVQQGTLSLQEITEDAVQQRLLTSVDPDVIIRTSGEYRISNFLLWQMAYSELFFLSKTWPEMKKQDLLEVIQAFAGGRDRRFGQ